MFYSKVGLEQLTERFEGLRLVAYQDVVGVWTIGYGHTGPEVHQGLIWTKEQAESALLADTHHAVACVNACTYKLQLTQGEFDALVDFVFNVGCAAFAKSSMLRMLNEGNHQLAAEQFEHWKYAGGHVVAGLLKRRLAEKQVFES